MKIHHENKVLEVLYIGSGKSAELCKKINLDNYTVVCVNNAWRLFEGNTFDYWVHSGDFPYENRPKIKNFREEISYKQYNKSIEEIAHKLKINSSSPANHLGYTIFFNGLYWIINELKPKTISLLGFDHDYNPKKVKKWLDNHEPNPQNKYLKPENKSLHDWSNEFFEGMDQDSFYGHGTPDPMRFGMSHLIDKMKQALNYARLLNTNIINLSPIESDFNKIIPLENGRG